jgi:arylsulfatase A-like enzyme
MTETRRKLLHTHYHSPRREATMTQISEAMGWRTYSSGNAHYGKLAQLVAEQVGFHPDGCHLNALTTAAKPAEHSAHLLITMRPQVAEALKQLSWV